MNDTPTQDPAEKRKAFAALVRQKGWKEPSPDCPRQEREATRYYLTAAWENFVQGNLAGASEHIAVAIAIAVEGELWGKRSTAA